MRKALGGLVIALCVAALAGASRTGTYQGGSYGQAGATYQAAGGAAAGGDNLLPQSEDFELSWSASNTVLTPDSTCAAPIRYAQRWEADGVTTGHFLRYDSWPLGSLFLTPEDAVFSCYVRRSNTQYVKLGLRNGNGTIYTSLWQNTGSGFTWVSDGAGITSHGQTALSGGWWRLWVHVNAAAEGLTVGTLENDPYIYVCGDGLKPGEGSYIWGAQYETGRTRPSGYKAKGAAVLPPGLLVGASVQNGDTATVALAIALASATNVRLVGRVERSVNFVADVDTVQIAKHETTRMHEATAWDIGDRLYRTDKIIVDAKAVGGSIVQSDTFVVEIDNAPLTVAHDGYIAGFMAQDDLDEIDKYVPYDPSSGVYDFMDQFDVGIMPRQFVEDATTTDEGYVVYGKTDWYRERNHDFIPLVYFYYFGYSPQWVNTTTYPAGTMARYQYDWQSANGYILRYAAVGGHAAGDTCFATWGSNTRAIVRTNPAGFVVDGGDTTWHYDLMARQLYDFYNYSSNMRDQTGYMADYMNHPGYIDSEGVDKRYIDMDNDGVAYQSDTNFLDWGVTEEQACEIANARMWKRTRELLPDNVLLVPNGKRSGAWAIPSQVADIDGKMLENWGIVGSAQHGKTWELFKSLTATYPDSLEAPAWDGPFNLVFWDNRFVGQPYRNCGTEGAALLGNGIVGSSLDFANTNGDRTAKALSDTARAIDLGVPSGPVTELRWGMAERQWTKGKVVVKWAGDRVTPDRCGWAVINTAGDTISQYKFHEMPDPENASWVFSGFNNDFAGYPFTLGNYDLPVLGQRRTNHIRQDTPTTDYHGNSTIYLKNIGPWADKNGDLRIGLLHSNLDALGGAHVDSAKINLIVAWDGFDAAAGDTLFFVGMEAAGLDGWLDNPITTYNEMSPGQSWPINWDSVTIGQLGGHYSFYAPTGTVAMTENQVLTVDITGVVQAASDSESWGGLCIIFRGTAGVNGFKSGALGSVQYAPWIEVWTSEP